MLFEKNKQKTFAITFSLENYLIMLIQQKTIKMKQLTIKMQREKKKNLSIIIPGSILQHIVLRNLKGKIKEKCFLHFRQGLGSLHMSLELPNTEAFTS